MRKRLLVASLVIAVVLHHGSVRSQSAPTVRIGLSQNAANVSLRAASAFTIQQNRTRTAKFTMIVSVDPTVTGAVTAANLQRRTLIELDGGKLIVLPKNDKVRIEAGGAPVEFDNRTYRGTIEVFGNSRNTFTIVNELPLEDYLLGVVPNELNPVT